MKTTNQPPLLVREPELFERRALRIMLAVGTPLVVLALFVLGQQRGVSAAFGALLGGVIGGIVLWDKRPRWIGVASVLAIASTFVLAILLGSDWPFIDSFSLSGTSVLAAGLITRALTSSRRRRSINSQGLTDNIPGRSGSQRRRIWFGLILATILVIAIGVYTFLRFDVDMRSDSAFVFDRKTRCLYFTSWRGIFTWMEAFCFPPR